MSMQRMEKYLDNFHFYLLIQYLNNSCKMAIKDLESY